MIFISDIKQLYHGKTTMFKLMSCCFLLILAFSANPNGVYLWLITCGLIFILSPLFKVKHDSMGLLILIWSAIYFLFTLILNSGGAGSIMLTYLFTPYACYIFGRYSLKNIQNNPKDIELFIILCIIAYSLNLWYLTITNVIDYGLISKDAIFRQFINDGNKVDLAATLFGLMASASLSGIPLFYISCTQKKIKYDRVDILYLISGLLSLIATVHLVNRTGLFILAAAFMTMLWYLSKDKPFSYIFRMLCVIIILYFIIINIPYLNDIADVYNNRLELESGNIANAGGRTRRWIDAISRIFYMPFGWFGQEKIYGYNYAHNLWLDIGRQSGLVPFILIVVITVMSFTTLLKLWKFEINKITLIFTGLNTTFFLASFVEPVFEGQPYFAYFYIFIWGMQSQYLNYLKRTALAHHKN